MKNQQKNNNEPLYHSVDRVLFLTFPMTVVLLVLMLFGQIEPLTALIAFAITFVVTFFFARPFLKELEVLIKYLKAEASGQTDAPTPKFAKRRREAFKIVEYFNTIKMTWLIKNKVLEAQTLSDSVILDRLPNPLLIINEQGVVVSANISARQCLGGGIVMKKISEVFPKSSLLPVLEDVLKNEIEQTTVDVSHDRKGQKTAFFKALVERLPDVTKTGGIVVIVLQDVSAFKIFEKSQTAFFANASHELKTPLSVLSGFIETLQGPARDDIEARAKFLPIMAEQVHHMTDLVQDLLALSRLQLNEDKAKTDTLLIPELVASVIQGLDAKAEAMHKSIHLDVVDAVPPMKGMRADLFRLFQNLIENALKYGKKKSDVMVTIVLKKQDESPKQVVSVSVHNTGNPIPADEVPHVFERFYRVSQKGDPISGTGLGLAIASEIVAQHDGRIDVVSSARKGTTFEVSLPVF